MILTQSLRLLPYSPSLDSDRRSSYRYCDHPDSKLRSSVTELSIWALVYTFFQPYSSHRPPLHPVLPYPADLEPVSFVYMLVTRHAQLFAIPQTVACQTPLSMECFRQKYWSRLPFPSPGLFPIQGLNPGLLHSRQILCILSYQGSPYLADFE